jgi:hypothetical protein
MVPATAGSLDTWVGATPPPGFAYFAGSVANFALQPALQKYTGAPSYSSLCGDCAVTVMPQTGSFNSTGAPTADGAGALVEQQLAGSFEAVALMALR